jgi:hypothetical protein
MEILPRA